jgi:hypothetical protein
VGPGWLAVINFILWKWNGRGFREKYEPIHVNTMVRALEQHVKIPHRILLVTDNPAGVDCPTHPLWDDHRSLPNISGQHLPSCYRRLKLFNSSTQREMGIPAGERIVSVDLDAVVIRDMTSMFDRTERFVGWIFKGYRGHPVINASMYMFSAGDLEEVWTEFNPAQSRMRSHSAGYLGSDQGHMSYVLLHKKVQGVSGWHRGDVLSFSRDVVKGQVPPSVGRIVFFAGSRKPWHAEVRKTATWVSNYVTYDERTAA